MNQASKVKIANAIMITVRDGKGDWSEIITAVNATGVKVKNWLEVRGIVQFLINEELIKRFDSVHVERYDLIEFDTF